MSDPTTPPALLTVAESCQALRISRWTFYRLVQQRQLQTLKIGRRRLVTTDAVERFIAHQAAAESFV